jgi:hypothetical protein
MKSFDAQFNASSPLSKAAQGKYPDASLNRLMPTSRLAPSGTTDRGV